jgi:acetyltransferase-like isoleucine patch superfamily enzyme
MVNLDNIQCDELIIGKNTFIDPSVIIRGINGNSKKIIIGDNTYIGKNVQIIIDELEIGDYCKIHHHTNIHGYKPCKIGHNAWIGQYCIIDSIGGVKIGNNCGVGAHSQLWSHIKYGDTLEGCRFKDEKELLIGNDVWFVGHCIVSPIVAKDKSMALVGSVITKDMEYNQIYGGSPAKNITDKIGNQFDVVDINSKFEKMNEYLNQSSIENIKIVINSDEFDFNDEITYFDVTTRTYTKKLTDNEIKFINYLLPDKAKFTPTIK